jgi:hypothetical protein
MPTFEERIQALEQENAARKKAEELLTIAVRALVSKEAFEKLQEQNGKLFDVLSTHNIFTNERLGDIQNQLIELDGKIVGQQTETRQYLADHTTRLDSIETQLTGHTTRFDRIEMALTQILERLPEKP